MDYSQLHVEVSHFTEGKNWLAWGVTSHSTQKWVISERFFPTNHLRWYILKKLNLTQQNKIQRKQNTKQT